MPETYINPPMQASPRAASIGTYFDRAVATHGNTVWELICDSFRPGQLFKTQEAAMLVATQLRISQRYAQDLTRAVLITVEDQGQGVVVRQGNTWHI